MLKRNVVILALVALVVSASSGQPRAAANQAAAPDSTQQPIYSKLADLKWNRIFPEIGEQSSEISILHVDPTTGATQLMIRMPANFHVPLHWHTANETHTVVSGTLVMQCEGKRETLGPGSFNFMPSKMHHEAWTPPGNGAVVFITVDAAWDINWVNGPPKPGDLVGASPR